MATVDHSAESMPQSRGDLDLALPQLLPAPPKSYGAAGSLVAHVLIGGLIAFVGSLPIPEPPQSDITIGTRNVTPLVSPPPINRPITLPELLSRPSTQGAPQATPGAEAAQSRPVPQPAPPKPLTLPSPRVQKGPELIAEAPALPAAQPTAPDVLKNAPISAAPAIQAVEQPTKASNDDRAKIAFESPSAQVAGRAATTGPNAGPLGRTVPMPSSTSIQDMGRVMARSGGGGLVVGDSIGDAGASGSLSRNQAAQSAVQVLGDTMGVDFRPYLVTVLASVRRNWLAVIPESARMGGRKGKVQVQLAIARDGSVPKLVIAVPSGTEALDRAAVAGVSASNPFPPLPSEFQGPQIRLQFTFAYNMQ